MRNWWDDETYGRFEDKAKCLVNQYSSFKTNLGGINGRLTCGENIADNGGIRQAYISHRKWIEEKKVEDVKLAGFENFTTDQLFFLGFASVSYHFVISQNNHIKITAWYSHRFGVKMYALR